MSKIETKLDSDKLYKRLEKLDAKIAQKVVQKSSRAGMTAVLKAAKAAAPKRTGALKKGIKLIGERSKFKRKKAYRIVFDRKFNDVFQTKNESGKVVGYYPVSMEYGFKTRNGRKIEGRRFIHNAFESTAKQMEAEVLKEMDALLKNF